jgi:hypothetical protein
MELTAEFSYDELTGEFFKKHTLVLSRLRKGHLDN